MRQIHRLLTIGETRRPTDEYLTLQHEWKMVSADNRFRAGEVQSLAHHPTRRLETVLMAEELDEKRMEFAKAALTGLCADQKLIADAMQRIAGGSQQPLGDVIGAMAVQFGDAALKRMEVRQ